MTDEKLTTYEWAKSLNVPVEDILLDVETDLEPYPRTAYEIAVRALILQGIVAVAYEVDPEPIIEWFHEQDIWQAVTPNERAFLLADTPPEQQRINFSWRKEAQWALPWMIGKVEALALPTHPCDSRRLYEEIIPPLGDDIQPFLASAKLRPQGVLLAEDDRTYNLWCYAHLSRRENKPLPHDLNMDVLYERVYAFEWLYDIEEWDEIQCHA